VRAGERRNIEGLTQSGQASHPIRNDEGRLLANWFFRMSLVLNRSER